MLPDWLEPTFVLFPLAAWMFLGIGLPWALFLLPRAMWRERVTVIAVALALGPLGLTAMMFLIDLIGGTLTLAATLLGGMFVMAVGILLNAWRDKGCIPLLWSDLIFLRRGEACLAQGRASSTPTKTRFTTILGCTRNREGTPQQDRLSRAEWLLAAGIALILLVSVIITAYWPFLEYDALWVYGYNAKIFILKHHIPSSMGYYPQLIPLSYTFMQQAWGGINDHAARVVVPWFNGTAVLMAYVLGRRAFESRRVGLLAAAVWAFYPHMLARSGAGDLEIPLTLYMTGASAFFIEAWRTGNTRAAVLSGLLLGGALWTKPTAGALPLGMMLAVVGWAVIARFRLSAIWPKLRIALIAGLASIPLGGMWYVRNVALGHTAVVFPASYWHERAQRSGQEFGWPLLIAALIVGGLLVHPPAGLRRRKRVIRLGLPLLALALLMVGILPTALNTRINTNADTLWRWARGDLGSGRPLRFPEVLLIAAGFVLLAWLGREAWRALPEARRTAVLLIWALLLPYGVVWFFDFSYHYRLSFAIVPLLAVQVAALIDGWTWDWLAAHRLRRWIGLAAGIGSVVLAAAAGLEFTVRAWFDGGLPDDRAKYDHGNPALMVVVHKLEEYAAEHGQPVVAIPGEDRLPFFFPTWDIRNNRDLDRLPTKLEDLGNADLFVNSAVNEYLLRKAGKWPTSLLADAAVGDAYWWAGVRGDDLANWTVVLWPIQLNINGSLAADDGIFRYNMYTIHPEQRTLLLHPNGPAPGTVIVGGFAQYLGQDMVSLDWVRGEKITLTLYWRPTDQAPPPYDYSIYLHLLDADGNLIAQWDGVPLQKAYPTLFWRPGESLKDLWILRLPPEAPTGPASLRIGIYDPLTGDRLPVVIDGVPSGDGITIETRIQVY